MSSTVPNFISATEKIICIDCFLKLPLKDQYCLHWLQFEITICFASWSAATLARHKKQKTKTKAQPEYHGVMFPLHFSVCYSLCVTHFPFRKNLLSNNHSNWRISSFTPGWVSTRYGHYIYRQMNTGLLLEYLFSLEMQTVKSKDPCLAVKEKPTFLKCFQRMLLLLLVSCFCSASFTGLFPPPYLLMVVAIFVESLPLAQLKGIPNLDLTYKKHRLARRHLQLEK